MMLLLSQLLAPAHSNRMHLATITVFKKTHNIILRQVYQVFTLEVPDEALDKHEQVLLVTRLLRLDNYRLNHLEELLANRAEN